MSSYWLTLQQQYQRLAKRVNQSMVLRERMLLLVVLLAVVYAIWSLLSSALLPQKASDSAKAEELSLTQQIKQLQQKIADVEKNVTTMAAGTATAEIPPGGGIVSSTMITPMLKALFMKYPGMSLSGLMNLPDVAMDIADTKLPFPIYEQRLTFVFNSNYVTTYEYLKAVEGLKWLIFWDELKYMVGQYPNAEVRLTLHTVSKEKEN